MAGVMRTSSLVGCRGSASVSTESFDLIYVAGAHQPDEALSAAVQGGELLKVGGRAQGVAWRARALRVSDRSLPNPLSSVAQQDTRWRWLGSPPVLSLSLDHARAWFPA